MSWCSRKFKQIKSMLTIKQAASHSQPKPESISEADPSAELSSMKVPELKALAKAQDIKKYYKMNKADLIAALSASANSL